jgi:CheY-like chemotaxis protein
MASSGKIARRILVVDDEPLICESIKRILDLDEHTVETAGNAQEALAAYESGKFDVVVIDYDMPGTKGDKLASTIKAIAPQQPIIMVTAYGESLRLAGNFPLAVERVISKPFDLQEFRDVVQELAEKTP